MKLVSKILLVGFYNYGPFRKFNVDRKRKLVAKGGRGIRKLIHTFSMVLATLISKAVIL